MKMRWLVPAMICLATAGAAAQRGGGRGAAALPRETVFDSAEYAIAFSAPSGLDLYTSEQPGRYRRLFGQRHIAILVNPMHTEETIAVRFSGNLTEADVRGFRDAMDRNPPQAALPGYERVSLQAGKIGSRADKDVVDYVYSVKQDKLDATIRQVVFVHRGKGFMITCTAEQKRFENANKGFSRFLSSLDFR